MSDECNDYSDITRRLIKDRLQNDWTKFFGHEKCWKQVRELFSRTSAYGESNSALLIGKRGSGKTMLISSILCELFTESSFRENTLMIYLNGYIHSDDRLALKSITKQLQLENIVGDKEFNSFADNLAFLLACLKSGNKNSTKSVIFILEEFDLFCAHHNQTLLYNLFDISQKAQSPICVLGITCRLDVTELLEKRVKSRFSHRQIYLFPAEITFDANITIVKDLLKLPPEKVFKDCGGENKLKIMYAKQFGPPYMLKIFDLSNYYKKIHNSWVTKWNLSIEELFQNSTLLSYFELLYEFDNSLATLKTFLYQLIGCLNKLHMFITVSDVKELYLEQYDNDYKVSYLCDLSVLEICLIITIKKHCEIYDREPFNFEIIYTRFQKFENSTNTFAEKRNVERSIIWKSYEHLKELNFIVPQTTTSSKTQKQFELHKLQLTYGQINQAISKYDSLPTEISQWANSSII